MAKKLIKLDDDLMEKLKIMAIKKRIPANTLISDVLAAYVEEMKNFQLDPETLEEKA